LRLPTNAAPKSGPSKRQDLGWNEPEAPGSAAVSTTRAASRPARAGFVGVAGAGPVEQRLEGVDLGDAQVVPGQPPHPRAAGEGGLELGPDAPQAAVLDERGDDGDLMSAAQERERVLDEGAVGAAGGKGADLGAGRAREVVATARDDVADAAARVVHVAAIARDDVHVQVHDGLPRGLTGVEADVVAVGAVAGVELRLDLVDEGEQRGALGVGGVEPVGDEAARDDEGVPGADGVAVAHGERERVGGDVLGRGDGEEGAGHG